jgi:hypothetical protein
MTNGTVDRQNRTIRDPMWRSLNWRFMTREQRNGRSMNQLLNSLARNGGGGGGGLSGYTGSVTAGQVNELPDTTTDVIGQFFLKRNNNAMDTINFGLTDADGSPMIVALNTLGPGSLDPQVGDFMHVYPPAWNIFAAPNPKGIAIGPAGEIYVSTQTIGVIRVYDSTGTYKRSVAPYMAVHDSATGSAGAAVGQFNFPSGIAVDSTGRILIVDRVNNRVQRFTAAMASPAALFTGLTTPFALALDPADNIYMTHNTGASGEVKIWNAAGVAQTSIALGATPSAVSVQKVGSITYVATLHGAGLLRIYSSSTAPTGFTLLANVGTLAGAINGIWLEPTTLRLYVVNQAQSRIDMYDWNGASTWTLVGQFGTSGTTDGKFTTPASITQHPITKNIFISDTGQTSFQEFTREGWFVRKNTTGASVAGAPAFMAFNAAGTRLYSADSSTSQMRRWVTPSKQFSPDPVTYTATGSNVCAVDSVTNIFWQFSPTTGQPIVAFDLNLYGLLTIAPGGWWRLPIGVVEGTALANVYDYSGHGLHATQATGANQPLTRSTNLSLNGFPGMDFDGTNDYLASTASASSIDTAGVAVVTIDTGAATRGIFGPSAAGGLTLYFDTTGQRLVLDAYGVTNIGFTANSSFSVGVPHVVSWNVTATTWEIGIDGTIWSGSHAVSLTAGLTLTIGSIALGFYWDGIIYDLARFPAHVTTAQRQLAEGIEAHKFGLQSQLVGGHPYQSTPPVVSAYSDLANGNNFTTMLDTVQDRIIRLDGSGILWQFSGGPGTGDGQFNNPVSIAEDTVNNRVYIADQGNRRVQEFTWDGLGYQSQFGSFGISHGQFDTPTAIALDDDRLWVADSGLDDVQIFDTTGLFLDRIGVGDTASALSNPSDIVFGANNLGYILDDDSGGRILLARLPLQNFPLLLTTLQDGDGLEYDSTTTFFKNVPGPYGSIAIAGPLAWSAVSLASFANYLDPATYSNYEIRWVIDTMSIANTALYFRFLDAAGAQIVGTGYNWSLLTENYTSAGAVTGSGTLGETSVFRMWTNTASGTNQWMGGVIRIINLNDASYTNWLCESHGLRSGADFATTWAGGVHSPGAATARRGFAILPSSGVCTGRVWIYAIRNP